MPENDRLNACLDDINLEFVEREATPRLLMKLSIQLHLAVLYLSNTVSIIYIFGAKRARSTVHNWVHKADLQPKTGRCPDHVAVDETVIRLNVNNIGCTLRSIPRQTNCCIQSLSRRQRRFLLIRF
jgi:transposase-like protein